MRVFVSIDIPIGARDEIVKIQKALPDFKGKATEPENLHLTLKFLGEIDEETTEKIRKKLKEINFLEFETEIDSLGFFDNTKSKKYSRSLVIWLHLTNCEKIQEKIDSTLSFLFEKEKRFMNHLTIARIKNIKNKRKFLNELRNIKTPKLKFPVKEFKLKKSVLTEKGPVYSDLETYGLRQ